MILYKRNAKGEPIFWKVQILNKDSLEVEYGIVDNGKGSKSRKEIIKINRHCNDAINSLVKEKRKNGYKELSDLYDNAPKLLESNDTLWNYLNTYLPKYNTHSNGLFIPMLCKILNDNKPFNSGTYFGQWKINGERCIITASRTQDLFELVKLHYRSREGIDWTNKLSYLDDILIPCISKEILDIMIEEGVGLDGELYLPGYGINEINSFIKNTELPQHYKLQFWLYDICIENMSAWQRQAVLESNFDRYRLRGAISKEGHLNNTNKLVYLYNYNVADINEAIRMRDTFISLGFEGLIIRRKDAEYQFGGKRNNSMLKFKKKLDGLFTIIDIIPEGIKRSKLGKFVLKNDINEETFECTYNATHDCQKNILVNKNEYIGKNVLVEYRERSGVTQAPFHAKGIKIID